MQLQGLRVLVLDDEDDICEMIRFNLEEEGFIVTTSQNGMDAWNKIQRHTPDAAILDFMVPGLSGLDLCRKIKEKYDFPVLMVTAKTGETDAVLCLEMGADDYIRKPFAPRELVARLRAVLRRSRPRLAEEKLQGKKVIGSLELDLDAHLLCVAGEPVHLTLVEFDLLRLFMENPRIAFSRDKLLDRVWGREVYISDRVVDVNIKRLREKLGKEKGRLETVRGVGYRFDDT